MLLEHFCLIDSKVFPAHIFIVRHPNGLLCVCVLVFLIKS